jgi:hypothetical protein
MYNLWKYELLILYFIDVGVYNKTRDTYGRHHFVLGQ